MVNNRQYSQNDLQETPSLGALPAVPAIAGTYYNYTYVDHGAQFRVYAVSTRDDIASNRVVKVPLGFEETREAIASHLERLGMNSAEIDKKVHQLLIDKQQLPALLQGIYAKDKRLMQLMGNLKIVPTLTTVPYDAPKYFLPLYFTQDYATPMSIFLHRFRLAYLPPRRLDHVDVAMAKELLRQIVKLHQSLWEYGVFERSLKIENMGIIQGPGKKFKVILLDAGEYTTDLEEARAIVQEKRWQNSMDIFKSDHLFLPTILHKDYTDTCLKGFTEKTLEARWQKRSNKAMSISTRQLRLREMLTRDKAASTTFWLQRQALELSQHSGIPIERIDNLELSRNELSRLLLDRRVNATPETIINELERAERHAFYDRHEVVDTDLFRHLVPYQTS